MNLRALRTLLEGELRRIEAQGAASRRELGAGMARPRCILAASARALASKPRRQGLADNLADVQTLDNEREHNDGRLSRVQHH